MCLIIASPEGKSPDLDIVGLAILDNPHGWGVVSAYNGRLTTAKGFGLPSLLRVIKRLRGPYLIHFRYATHGAVGIVNCHPFKVNPDCYMVHNGILSIPLVDSRYSDSWHFARMYARPYIATHGYSNLIPDTEHFIRGGNKVVYIRRSGDILIANELAGTWKDELWYSNEYSFPWVPDPAWDMPLWGSRSACGVPIDATGYVDTPETGLANLEAITCDSDTECEYCSVPARTLYLEPDTQWYVCVDCAGVLIGELEDICE